jgi:hypothetical protein
LIVTALTGGALALVGVLAVQASGSAPTVTAKPSASPSASAKHHTKAAHHPSLTALPAHSGKGARVVYSLHADRVWLVSATGHVTRTFRVYPGTVDPTIGVHKVYSPRSTAGIGGDGVAIVDVVRFAQTGPTVIGFSAARNGSVPSSPSPGSTVKTGGIREHLADAAALWKVATVGTEVVVVD